MMVYLDVEKALSTVENYITGVNTANLNVMRKNLTDDYVQWHAHICKNFTWEEETEILNGLFSSAKLILANIKLTPITEGVLKQFTIQLQAGEQWLAKDIPAAVIFRFRNDKIYRAEEFFDSARSLLEGLPVAEPVGQVRGKLDSKQERTTIDIKSVDWDIENNTKLASAFGAALESGDFDALTHLLDTKVQIEFCSKPELLTKNEYVEALKKHARRFVKQSYRDIEILFHPNGFVWQATLEENTRQSSITLPLCIVASTANKKIVRVEHYFDSAPLTQI